MADESGAIAILPTRIRSGRLADALRRDKQWAYGDPPGGNANNYAWIQHFVHYFAYRRFAANPGRDLHF